MEDEKSSEKRRYRAKYTGRRLLHLAERYILDCRGGDEGVEKRFPNIAGFCRFLGISRRRYEELGELYPEELGIIEATFEDEALNNGCISTSLLSLYLKARLGYAEAKSEKASGGAVRSDNGRLSVIFEHDILRDGE